MLNAAGIIRILTYRWASLIIKRKIMCYCARSGDDVTNKQATGQWANNANMKKLEITKNGRGATVWTRRGARQEMHVMSQLTGLACCVTMGPGPETGRGRLARNGGNGGLAAFSITFLRNCCSSKRVIQAALCRLSTPSNLRAQDGQYQLRHSGDTSTRVMVANCFTRTHGLHNTFYYEVYV